MENLEMLLTELAALRTRVEALEANQGTVHAPFRVVDEAGRPLFSVQLTEDGTEGPSVEVKLHDRRTGDPVVEIVAGESAPDGIPACGGLQIGSGTIIGPGEIELTGLFEDRRTGEPDRIIISTTRQPHIDLYMGQAGDQPMLELTARDYAAGIHIARCNSSVSACAQRGVFLGITDRSPEPGLTLWNAQDQPVVEISVDQKANGHIVLGGIDGERHAIPEDRQ
jgi:hypothetical protein